jgi:hypothetical protein
MTRKQPCLAPQATGFARFRTSTSFARRNGCGDLRIGARGGPNKRSRTPVRRRQVRSPPVRKTLELPADRASAGHAVVQPERLHTLVGLPQCGNASFSRCASASKSAVSFGLQHGTPFWVQNIRGSKPISTNTRARMIVASKLQSCRTCPRSSTDHERGARVALRSPRSRRWKSRPPWNRDRLTPDFYIRRTIRYWIWRERTVHIGSTKRTGAQGGRPSRRVILDGSEQVAE